MNDEVTLSESDWSDPEVAEVIAMNTKMAQKFIRKTAKRLDCDDQLHMHQEIANVVGTVCAELIFVSRSIEADYPDLVGLADATADLIGKHISGALTQNDTTH